MSTPNDQNQKYAMDITLMIHIKDTAFKVTRHISIRQIFDKNKNDDCVRNKKDIAL